MSPDKPKKIRLDTAILEGLKSEREPAVLKTLNQLRSSGSIHYIPELLNLLAKTDNENIIKELIRFMADIKDPGAIPFLIKSLKENKYEAVRSYIVSTCWQSSLDFSGEIPLFISLFLKGDYMTAIECFTVIEECAMEMEAGERSKIREMVIDGLDQVNDEKKPLAKELIRTLS